MNEQQEKGQALSPPVSRLPPPAVFRWMLIGSACVHLTLTPAMSWLGVLSWLAVPVEVPPPASESLHTLEIDIDWLQPAKPTAEATGGDPPVSPDAESSGLALDVAAAAVRPAQPSPPEEEQAAAPEPVETEPEHKARGEQSEALQRPDAGASDTPSDQSSDSAHAAPPKRVAAPRSKGVSPDGTATGQGVAPSKSKHGDGHPVASLGLKSKAVDKDAAVNLLLSMETIRTHAVGKRIGGLLRSMPQWRSFFATTGIDPVADLEHLLVVAPNLSRSSQLVAVVQHSLPPKRMREAVDTLVRRPPKGRWLGTKPSAALAHADGAERLFVLSAPEVLVVAPPTLLDHLLSAPIGKLAIAASAQAAVAHIKNPAVVLARVGVGLPPSLQWIRVSLQALPGGAGRLEMEILDETPALAARHAPQISAAINALTNPSLGALGALLGVKTIAILDPIELQANGSEMRGAVGVSPHQLNRLLAYAEGWVEQRLSRRGQAPGRRGSAPLPAAGKSPTKSTP